MNKSVTENRRKNKQQKTEKQKTDNRKQKTENPSFRLMFLKI